MVCEPRTTTLPLYVAVGRRKYVANVVKAENANVQTNGEKNHLFAWSETSGDRSSAKPSFPHAHSLINLTVSRTL